MSLVDYPIDEIIEFEVQTAFLEAGLKTKGVSVFFELLVCIHVLTYMLYKLFDINIKISNKLKYDHGLCKRDLIWRAIQSNTHSLMKILSLNMRPATRVHRIA